MDKEERQKIREQNGKVMDWLAKNDITSFAPIYTNPDKRKSADDAKEFLEKLAKQAKDLADQYDD